jgi:molybdopterin/thiamine biosynthesis adenylyltransferase
VSLSGDDLERYARHIVLREIGGAGQQRLRAARVLMIGAGGLGSPALLYLAAAGAGVLGVADDGQVSLSNLQRQILFGTCDIGASKVESAKGAVGRINAGVQVNCYPLRLDAGNIDGIVAGYDLVLDGCDNFSTRYVVNAACVAAAKPLISAAMSQWEGQISLFDPARGGPCYACIFPQAPDPGLAPSCAEAGVIGALPGILGSMMALEAIKLIARAGTGLRGRMQIFDGLHGETRWIKTAARADCAVCNGSGV